MKFSVSRSVEGEDFLTCLPTDWFDSEKSARERYDEYVRQSHTMFGVPTKAGIYEVRIGFFSVDESDSVKAIAKFVRTIVVR